MTISDNYVPLVYGRQNNKSPLNNTPAPVNLGPGALPAFPANTYSIDRNVEPVNALLYDISNILQPAGNVKQLTPMQSIAASILQALPKRNSGYDWGMPSYIPKDTPDSYGTITDGVNTLSVDSSGNISGSGSTSGEPEKTQKKKGLQKLTSDISTTSSEKPKVANTTEAPVSVSAPVAPIQIARPDYTNVAYGSQVQPMAPTQPAESPIDESYYRYLRNNGWNDFDARRQAIRYY